RLFFFSSRRRHTRFSRDWSSDVCSSDLFVHKVKARTPCLGNEPFHPIHNLFGSNGLINLDVVERNITKRTLPPITPMRHSELVPSAVTPQPVHGIHYFNHRNILAQIDIRIVRATNVGLFVVVK